MREVVGGAIIVGIVVGFIYSFTIDNSHTQVKPKPKVYQEVIYTKVCIGNTVYIQRRYTLTPYITNGKLVNCKIGDLK